MPGEVAEVSVADATGRVVLRQTIAPGAALGVSVLPKGVYGVRVTTGNVETAVRLVVE